MLLESRKYLFDIVEAAKLLNQFSAGKTFADYLADPLLRSGVERQFEIVGEALAQLVRVEPAVAARISEYKKIVSFRNLLIHGYAQVDHQVVWEVLDKKLPTLLREAQDLLSGG